MKTLEPALLDSHKMTFSLGGRFRLHQRLHLGVTFTDIAYFKVDTKGQNLLNKWQGTTRQPSTDGVYKHNIFLTNIYFDVNF